MKDKLNRFMQGRYGVDNFARFTLGVALFVIVVRFFYETKRSRRRSGYSWIYSYHLYIFQNPFQKYLCTICGKTRNIWDILRKSAAGLPEKKI